MLLIFGADPDSGLHGSGRSEGIAGSARALVPNGGNKVLSADVSPVEIFGERCLDASFLLPLSRVHGDDSVLGRREKNRVFAERGGSGAGQDGRRASRHPLHLSDGLALEFGNKAGFPGAVSIKLGKSFFAGLNKRSVELLVAQRLRSCLPVAQQLFEMLLLQFFGLLGNELLPIETAPVFR